MASKFTKSEVNFEHPAKGMHDCGECKHFYRTAQQCEIVTGYIEADDWCRKWAARNGGLKKAAKAAKHGIT